MSEFTLKAIEHLLDATLQPITAEMAALRSDMGTLKSGVAKLATRDELAVVSSKLDDVKATVDSHTKALDTIIKNTSNWEVEMTVMRGRMERYESALKAIGEKLNLDIASFLH